MKYVKTAIFCAALVAFASTVALAKDNSASPVNASYDGFEEKTNLSATDVTDAGDAKVLYVCVVPGDHSAGSKVAEPPTHFNVVFIIPRDDPGSAVEQISLKFGKTLEHYAKPAFDLKYNDDYRRTKSKRWTEIQAIEVSPETFSAMAKFKKKVGFRIGGERTFYLSYKNRSAMRAIAARVGL